MERKSFNKRVAFYTGLVWRYQLWTWTLMLQLLALVCLLSWWRQQVQRVWVAERVQLLLLFVSSLLQVQVE